MSSKKVKVTENPREIVARLQEIEAEINILRAQSAAVREEMLALQMAKNTIGAVKEGYEEYLFPGDPKGNILLKSANIDNNEILVRISRQVYVPLPPERAVEFIEKRIKELESVAASIEERVKQLSNEYAILGKKAELLMRTSNTEE